MCFNYFSVYGITNGILTLKEDFADVSFTIVILFVTYIYIYTLCTNSAIIIRL